MNDFARHYRIFTAQSTDDLVEKRTRAISELTQAFKRKTDASAVLQLAKDLIEGLSLGKLPLAICEQVAKAISKPSPSFVPEENELEVLVCALLAALQYLRTTKPAGAMPSTHDLFACALLSGLEFQVPLAESRLEVLRLEIRDAAAEFLRKRAEDGRKRLRVPDVAVPTSTEGLSATTVNAAIKDTIDALRTNERLDREELDLLWWVLSDWSELLGAHFSRCPGPSGLVACGLEAAGKLKHLPAEAHFQLVLRHAIPGQQSNLQELLDAVSNDLSSLRREHETSASLVISHRVLFPLLAALVEGTSAGVSAVIQRTNAEWARRSLLESVLARHFLSMRA
jgi:hypothetical protein